MDEEGNRGLSKLELDIVQSFQKNLTRELSQMLMEKCKETSDQHEEIPNIAFAAAASEACLGASQAIDRAAMRAQALLRKMLNEKTEGNA